MRLDASDIRDLEPVIEVVVRRVLDRVEAERARVNGRLSYSEARAAELLDVNRHQLRDARRRGEIEFSRCGKKILYTRTALLEFLHRKK